MPLVTDAEAVTNAFSDPEIQRWHVLVTGWRGQGGVAIGSLLPAQRLVAGRHDG